MRQAVAKQLPSKPKETNRKYAAAQGSRSFTQTYVIRDGRCGFKASNQWAGKVAKVRSSCRPSPKSLGMAAASQKSRKNNNRSEHDFNVWALKVRRRRFCAAMRVGLDWIRRRFVQSFHILDFVAVKLVRGTRARTRFCACPFA